jgi:hypothetical protein
MRMETKVDGVKRTTAEPSQVPARDSGSSSSSSDPRCTEEPGAGRWSLIFPGELVFDAGIACRAHRRPTGLLHSCGEAFCEECFALEAACPKCQADLPTGGRELRFCCD